MKRLKNRREAGRLLASRLDAFAGRPNVLTLALPRGGVPVAFEVAKAIGAPLDVFLVRKLGVPGHEELAMGAVSNGAFRVLNNDVIEALGIPPKVVDRVAEREFLEIDRREAVYRRGRPALAVDGATVLIIDDGLATGSTMLAALRALRVQRPAALVAAVPVSPLSTCEQLRAEADELICLFTPEPFWGVGQWYDDFSQTSDEEVVKLLADAQGLQGRPPEARTNLGS